MKVLDYLLAPLALAGLVATGWWGLYQSPQRPANLAAQLEQDANAALARNGYDWAHVRMKGQRAVLQGPAPSDDAAMAAAETVLRSAGPGGVVVGGVTVVEVAVDPGKPVSPYVWRAEKTPDGAFILSGHAPSERIAEQLAEEARRLADGQSPQNGMKVAAGWPGGNWQGVARLGLDILAEAESGTVRLTDKTLRVSAVETDPAVRADLSARVKNLAAPYKGEPLIHGLATWTAKHTEEGLVLDGKVPDEVARQSLMGLAQANFSGNVIDRMETAPDMPAGWLEAVRTGLPYFARFRAGEMGFYPSAGDAGLAIEGEAAPSTAYFLKRDMAAAAAGADPTAPVTIWTYPADVPVPEADGIDFSTEPAAVCQQAFDAVLDANELSFEAGSAAVSRESGPALDRLVTVSHLCAPDLLIEIVGQGDSDGEAGATIALGRARAEAVMTYIVSAGFDPARLSAVGYGPDPSGQSNDTAEGRAAGRRIVEFRVRTRSD